MRIRQLKHFATVAQTLHFGRAADLLGMTQPPLSQSIMALEQEIGAPLFVRTKRSVALTPFGAAWLEPVHQVLEGMAALPQIAHELKEGTSGRLQISFVSTADYSVLPKLVRNYTELFPKVDVALTEATSDVQIEKLLGGKVDIGIVIPPPTGVFPKPLSYLPLLTEPLIAAVPESWVAAQTLPMPKGLLSPERVVDAPLILFPRHSAPAFHDLVTGYIAAHDGTPQIVQEAVQMQTIISLVSAGMGIALVPASLRNLARTGVRYMDLAGDAPVLETGLAWNGENITPPVAHFLQIAQEVVAQDAPL
jgi:DNA-binding transcriptional LysR family regulator